MWLIQHQGINKSEEVTNVMMDPQVIGFLEVHVKLVFKSSSTLQGAIIL
jgi:hypothetical protein